MMEACLLRTIMLTVKIIPPKKKKKLNYKCQKQIKLFKFHAWKKTSVENLAENRAYIKCY